MDGIPLGAVGVGSGWVAFVAIVLLIVRLIVRGDWLPRTTHAELMTAEREKSAAAIERAEAAEALSTNLAAQNKVLLDSAIPTVNTVLKALHQAAGGD